MKLWKCKRQMSAAFSMTLLSATMVKAEQPLFLASNEVPAGFEVLSEPQQSLIDIYYGNRYLTSQLATFQSGNVTFSNPAELIRQIGSINDPEFIKTALSGELATHNDKICIDQQPQGCGIITPPVAGVIFDENRFRADIFINPRFLLTRSADVRKYLPPSDAGFALLQNFSAVASGSTQKGSRNDYTLNGLTLLSYKENSLYASWDYSKTQHFSVDQFFAQREFEGKEYNLGFMSSRSFGLSFTSDQPLLGVRVESSDNTRNDTSFSGGMPIEIYMPLRGRIEVRRDQKLIASFFHEAGLQQLDTSGFPSGAYDVEILILDEQGNEQYRTDQFFAKQYQLPPVGEWRYFAETGRVMTRTSQAALPSATQQWLTRGGVSRRLSDTLAGTLAFAGSIDASLLELGFYNFGYRYELSPSLMMADNGDYGLALNSRVWLGDVSLSGFHRQLWKSDPFETSDVDRPALLAGGSKQTSISASMPLMGGSASYRFGRTRNGDSESVNAHLLSFRTGLFRSAKSDTSLEVSLGESEGGIRAFISLEWRFKDNRWNYRASPRTEIFKGNGLDEKSESLRLSASWEDGDLYDGNLRFNAGAELGDDQERVDGSVQYANHYGRGTLNVNRVFGGSEDITSYSGSFSTSLLTDGDVVAIGGEQSAESAVVVNVDGRDGDVFDVKINGSRRGYAVAGQASVIPLNPFEQYDITLSPSGNTFYSFDESQRSFTLYPGNVVTLDYEAIALQLLFGRLLLNGEPLNGARISGGLYSASTDDIGLFQLESRSDVSELQVELENGWLCTLGIPANEKNNVLRMGTIDLADAECAPQLEGQLAISKRKES